MVTIEQVITRLSHFGYTVEDADKPHLEYELNLTLDYVHNYCNITDIPTILDRRITDRVCAYFLYNKKNSGTLKDFNYDTVIKQIKEGDTTIHYATGQGEDTPENRFDAFVKQLERGFDKWLTPHRRLRW